MEKKVKLVVPICSSQHKYISASKRLFKLLQDAKSQANDARDNLEITSITQEWKYKTLGTK